MKMTNTTNPRVRHVVSIGIFGTLLVAVFLGSPIGVAADPPPAGVFEVTRDDVLDWIDDLDAPNLARRKAAEAALMAMDPKWIEVFPAVDNDTPIETRSRLDRIIAVLRAKQVGQAPKMATVEVDLSSATNLADALEAISRSSGVEFEYDATKSMPITPVNSPLSFWHAVDLVLDQTHLDVNPYGGSRSTMSLVPRSPDRPSRVDSAAYTGVYRVEPTSMSATRSMRAPALSGLNVTLEIAWRPGQTPIGLEVPIDEISGKLSDGERLRPQSSAETIHVSTTADLAMTEFYVPIQLPAKRADSIEHIGGTLRAILPGPLHTFDLPLDKIDIVQNQDAMSVKIPALRTDGPLHSIRLEVAIDADAMGLAKAMESHQQWLIENEAYIRRPDGSRADHLGFEVYQHSGRGTGIAYLFDLGGDSVAATDLGTFVYKSATMLSPDEVSFLITDIPLP